MKAAVYVDSKQQASLQGFGTEQCTSKWCCLFDYGTIFTHVSEKFKLSGNQEGKKQVIFFTIAPLTTNE